MFRLSLSVALLLLSAPLYAAALPPAFCEALVKHVKDADVAYQPGIDVDGNPVAPADLDAAPSMALPDELVLPLTVEMFQFLKVDRAKFPFKSMARDDIYIGAITLRGDRLFWNGQPLDDAQQDNLAVLCLQPSP